MSASFVSLPAELVGQVGPSALALFAAVAANGGITDEGCPLTIADLGDICLIGTKTARRDLAALARDGWIVETARPGYTTIRRVSV